MAANRQQPPTDEPSPGRVRTALDDVTDPELDRSIVELGYVDDVRVDGDGGTTVHVDVTLPTAWCSPAFAWMMATDARDAVEERCGVDRCTVELHDHMHAAAINDGVNNDREFADAFPDADDGVASVRATLDEKARLARQYDAVEALLDAGLSGEQVATLDRAAVTVDDDRAEVAVRDGGVVVTAPAEPLERYRRKATAVGLFDGESDRFFRTPDGDPVDPGEFDLVRKRSRLAAVNMDGQGGVCDALHDARTAQTDD